MILTLLPNKVKVNTTIDDIRLRSNSTTNKTIRFTKKSFFYTKLGFIQTHSGPSSDIKGFVQKLPGTYKSQRPNNFTGIDKFQLKCYCIIGSIKNGIREPILYSFARS